MKVGRATIDPRAQRWLRFIIGGGINTGFSYLVYLGINAILPYHVAYLIAYAVGVVFSYWFNARVVFRVPLSWKGLAAYPVVYIVQYLVSALCLGGLVEFFQISELIAPLVVAVAMIPLTYLMSKLVLDGKNPSKA
jgi:putative flippase GtrA